MIYEHTIYDEDDQEHTVVVEYNMLPYLPATMTDPSEGGCEILSVECETKELSKREIDEASQEAARYANDCEREGKWGFI